MTLELANMTGRTMIKKEKEEDLVVAKMGEIKLEPDFITPNYAIFFFVGSNREEFMVHKEFVHRFSPVLRKALNSPNKLQAYEMPNAAPGVFRLLSSYFYNQELDLLMHSITKEIDKADEKHIVGSQEHGLRCAEQDQELVGLYILAGELEMPGFQDLVIKHMYRISETCGPMTTKVLRIIFEKTPVGSSLRRLAVDQFCWLANIRALIAGSNDFPKDMVVEMAVEFWQHVPRETFLAR